MLEVHPIHLKIKGFKDFLLHLLTITIGLLIALGLEGVVEWRHHRLLVDEAEAGLHNEITQNWHSIRYLRKAILSQQNELDADLKSLERMRTHRNAPQEHLSVTFKLQSFDDVRWKTAQTTGAFTLMPYEDAKKYSDIYEIQSQFYVVEQQAVDDALYAESLVVAQRDNQDLTPAQMDAATQSVGMIQMRLLLLSSLVDELEKSYQQYEPGRY
jgi:hypothetical protein